MQKKINKILVISVLILNFLSFTTRVNASDIKGIEPYDCAVLEYKLWVDDDHNNIIDNSTQPYQEVSVFSINVSASNLIGGFYNNILGLHVGQTVYFQLPANIDENEDGVDDITGKEVLSYGSPSSQFFNTSIAFWVQVISINGNSTNWIDPNKNNSTSETENLFEISSYDLLWLAVGSGLMIHIILRKREIIKLNGVFIR